MKMAAKDRQRRENGGKARRNKVNRQRLWRRWHHGQDEARVWTEAVERLSRRDGAA